VINFRGIINQAHVYLARKVMTSVFSSKNS